MALLLMYLLFRAEHSLQSNHVKRQEKDGKVKSFNICHSNVNNINLDMITKGYRCLKGTIILSILILLSSGVNKFFTPL